MLRVAAVVLAAGRSSRFQAAGGAEATKLVAKLEGRPIVRSAVDAALASRASPVVVVVGHARGAVEAAVEGSPVTIAFNPDFEAGIASSLKVGLAAAPPGCDGAVVLLGDMPNVAPRLIDDLIAAFEARPTAQAVAPIRDGRRGNPVLLSRTLFGEAMDLVGDEGARRLLLALEPGAVAEIAAASDVSFDVDTPDDLAVARTKKREPPGRSG
ncbi:MAG TPA: nucleotidyltransferase family protein [Roseiarcus sp.]|nr:nucleotidyltransferase family protein [Roseiarcus sp.]